MFKNYWKITLRNLIRYKTYNILNILGLALGISIFLLSYLYVSEELSYDKGYTDYSRIFRVSYIEKDDKTTRARYGTVFPAAKTLVIEYPEIESAVRYVNHPDYLGVPLVTKGDLRFLENKLYYADSNFFQLFDFEFVAGNPQTALSLPNAVVITESTAKKYFKDKNPLNQALTVKLNRVINNNLTLGDYELLVTAVVKDLPSNTNFQFDFLAAISLSPYFTSSADNWFHQSFDTYFLLDKTANATGLESKLPEFVQRNFDPDIKQRITMKLQPIKDVHLKPLPGEPDKATNKMISIYVISAIALLILVVACINFMNLATAQSLKKAKEVGIRKVSGAMRKQIIVQFLFESIVLGFIAIIIGIGLAVLALPSFNILYQKQLSLNLFTNFEIIWILILVGFIVGIISGSYPALYLSSFRPVKVLKSAPALNRKSTMRQLLIIGQFVITLLLLIGINVVYRQMKLLQDSDLGFDAEEYVFLRTKGKIVNDYPMLEAFKEELMGHPNIITTAGTWSLPFGINAPVFNYHFKLEGYEDNDRRRMSLIRADHDFVEAFDINVILGRSFSRDILTDNTEAFLLNEAALKFLGWEEDPLGKELEVYSGGGNSFKKGQVIGVFKDFNFASLHQDVKPLVISMVNQMDFRYLAIKVNKEGLAETLKEINHSWDKFVPDWPIELFFLDDELKENYLQEQKLADSIMYLTVIGVIITSLGLLGLASFLAEQRSKEIGVRKVLGASVTGILLLLSNDFIKLIFIAILIASPIGWYLTQNWLNGFAYKIDLSWQPFILATVFLVIVTLLSVGFKSIKAATLNPVISLKDE